MILKDLLERSDYSCVQGDENAEISSLVYDSRKIEKDSVFVCISGYILPVYSVHSQALRSGARHG